MKISVMTEPLTRTAAPVRRNQVGSFLCTKVLKEAQKTSHTELKKLMEELKDFIEHNCNRLIYVAKKSMIQQCPLTRDIKSL